MGGFSPNCDTLKEGTSGGDLGVMLTSRCDDFVGDFSPLSAAGGSARGESRSGGARAEDEKGQCGKTTEMGDGGGARSGTLAKSVRIVGELIDRWEKKKDLRCCNDDLGFNYSCNGDRKAEKRKKLVVKKERRGDKSQMLRQKHLRHWLN